MAAHHIPALNRQLAAATTAAVFTGSGSCLSPASLVHGPRPELPILAGLGALAGHTARHPAPAPR